MHFVQKIFCRHFTRPRLYVHSRLGEYVPQDEEPGNFQFPKKEIPNNGSKPFTYHISAWRRRLCRPEDHLPPVNIGLSVPKYSDIVSSSSENDMIKLEAEARHRTLIIPIDQVEMDYEIEARPKNMIQIAKKYGLFRDLFSPPHFFTPWIPLHLYYTCVDDKSMVTPVYSGNHISPLQTAQPPFIRFAAPSDQLFTLILTSLDSCIDREAPTTHQEVLHWMVANLSTADTEKQFGQEVVPYLPPIPMRGTGHHRLVFLLFRQDGGFLADPRKMLNATDINGDDLKSRSWSTKCWYEQHQDDLTPGGLAFFQTAWDKTVRHTFRNVLNLPEPCYEYDAPFELPEPEQAFPHAKSFNKYFDTYRDTADIAEEVLRQRLTNSSLKGCSKVNPLNYPLAEPMDIKDIATEEPVEEWRQDRRRDQAARKGYWGQLEPVLRSAEEDLEIFDSFKECRN